MDIYTKDAINNKLAKKQDTLVSGTNIKTINGNSLLGSGDVTISGSGSGDSVSSAYYANSNTQLNGLNINGTNYKLLDVKVNDGSNLIIGSNRSLTSGASNVTAIGACDSAAASSSASIAIGHNSTASGDLSTVIGESSSASSSASIAIGHNSTASGDLSTVIGTYSTASGNYSTAIGYNSKVYVPYWVSFDGDTNHTLALQSTDNIFFRNEYVDSKKTEQESYTSGKTLTQLLNEKQSDKLVRINISNIKDDAAVMGGSSLVFVGFYDLINNALETMGLSLDSLSSNWKTLMAGEYATQIWRGLGFLLSMGSCFGCFYKRNDDMSAPTLSPIINLNYLGYVILNGTTPEGHIVFNSESALKTAFANSSMTLDD